ncbi:hypothetical protein ATKI12_5052 [Kitasatospora sp. Ki12]
MLLKGNADAGNTRFGFPKRSGDLRAFIGQDFGRGLGLVLSVSLANQPEDFLKGAVLVVVLKVIGKFHPLRLGASCLLGSKENDAPNNPTDDVLKLKGVLEQGGHSHVRIIGLLA